LKNKKEEKEKPEDSTENQDENARSDEMLPNPSGNDQSDVASNNLSEDQPIEPLKANPYRSLGDVLRDWKRRLMISDKKLIETKDEQQENETNESKNDEDDEKKSI